MLHRFDHGGSVWIVRDYDRSCCACVILRCLICRCHVSVHGNARFRILARGPGNWTHRIVESDVDWRSVEKKCS